MFSNTSTNYPYSNPYNPSTEGEGEGTGSQTGASASGGDASMFDVQGSLANPADSFLTSFSPQPKMGELSSFFGEDISPKKKDKKQTNPFSSKTPKGKQGNASDSTETDSEEPSGDTDGDSSEAPAGKEGSGQAGTSGSIKSEAKDEQANNNSPAEGKADKKADGKEVEASGDEQSGSEKPDAKDSDKPKPLSKAQKALNEAKELLAKAQQAVNNLPSDAKQFIRSIETGLTRFTQNGMKLQGLISLLGSGGLNKLDYRQGRNQWGMRGTCGVISTKNAKNALELANGTHNFISSNNAVGTFSNNGWCGNVGQSGPDGWINGMKHFGIYGGHKYSASIQDMRERVNEGRAVEFGLNAGVLGSGWGRGGSLNHAVASMGSVSDLYGNVSQAIVNSGAGKGGRGENVHFIPEELLARATSDSTNMVYTSLPNILLFN